MSSTVLLSDIQIGIDKNILTSNSSDIITDEHPISQNIVQFRGQGAQRPPGSAWSAGGAKLKVPEVDALKSISASISDDFSHKDKVEARRLSALQNKTQKRDHKADLSRSSGTEQMADQEAPLTAAGIPRRRPRREPGGSESFNKDSNSRPQKRSRWEQTSRTVLPLDVENLDSHALEDLIREFQERSGQLGSKEGSIKPPCQHLTLHRLQENRGKPKHVQQTPSWHFQKSAPQKPELALYFDPPQLTRGQDGQGMLRSQLPVTNFDLYLEQNKDISFVVYKTYEMPQDTSKNRGKGSKSASGQILGDTKVHESIQPVNEAVMNAVIALLETEDGYESILEDFRETYELHSPYLFVFHRRNDWDRIRRSLPETCRHQMTMLWNYVLQSHEVEYAAADNMIANGRISPGLLKYLFKPGQLLVQRRPEGMQGLMCMDWPKEIHQGEIPSREPESMIRNKSQDLGSNRMWGLNAWHWEFDGAFRRQKITPTVSTGSGTNEKLGSPIDTLDIFPLSFASHETIDQIRIRGENFWKCRNRALVSYRGAETNDDNLVSSANFHLSNCSGLNCRPL